MPTFDAKNAAGTPQTLNLADVTEAGTPSSTALFTVQGNASGTPVPTTLSGTVPLPTGASTAAAQTTAQASFSSIDSKLVTPTAPGTPASTAATVQIAQGGVAVPVSLTGTPALATGASTAANQTTQITSLQSLDTKTTVCNTGNVTVASVTPPGTPVGGNQTVGTTAAAGPAITLTAGAIYKADDDNTDSIYIGVSSSVSSTKTNANTMHRLKAGQSVYLPANNANKYFFISGAVTQTLYILGA